MAFAPDSVGFTYGDSSIQGCFRLKENDNYFEYSLNNERESWCDFPHKVWVGDVVGQGYRYGFVKKTVAYVAVDEDEFGLPVVEKWDLKQSRVYD
tara:strand:- start:358 stop:642 length:285 start_codon:yes stop_codon:yes gene_type:complete